MSDWKIWAAFVAMVVSTTVLILIVVNVWIPLAVEVWNEIDVSPIEIRIIQEKGSEP